MFRRAQRLCKQAYDGSKKYYHNNPFKQYIEKYGERPRFFEEKGSTSVWPLVLGIVLVPLVLTPTYIDYFVMKDRKNGDDLVKDFATYRQERDKDHDDQEAHSANKNAASAVVTPILVSKSYKYVIVGGGTAAYSALQQIKKNDPYAEVLLISEEQMSPYTRPPLSKELWASTPAQAQQYKYKNWQGKETPLEYRTADYYTEKNKVFFKRGSTVVKMNVDEQTITCNDGQTFKYEKCLLATGGTPRIIPGDQETLASKVTTFRNIQDFDQLNTISQQSDKQILVVGGSFLGTELAYALAAHRKAKVAQVYLEPEVLARNLPRFLCQQIRDTLVKAGVQLKPNRNVIAVEKKQDGRVAVKFDNGEEMIADHVVTCVGIFPNTELAENAGLEIDPVNGGVMTNAELEARNNVFVAGDVLSYHDPVLGRRRCEHYEHAQFTGELAGKNMSTNKRQVFDHISMFWSDVGNISFEAVGEINSRLNTYSVWDGVDIVQHGTPWSMAPAPLQSKKFRKGIVYYLSAQNRVVGIVMWNVHNKVNDARKLILEKKEYKNVDELSGKIEL